MIKLFLVVVSFLLTAFTYAQSHSEQYFINYIQGYWKVDVENTENYNLYIGRYVYSVGPKPVSDPSQSLLMDYKKYSRKIAFASRQLLNRIGEGRYDLSSFKSDSSFTKHEMLQDVRIDTSSYDPISMMEYSEMENAPDTVYTIQEFWEIYQPSNNNSFAFEIDKKPYPVQYTRITDPPQFVKDFEKKMRSIIFRKIIAAKASIYKDPNNPTKMYLEQGDEVEPLSTQGDWVKIRYYGKRIIEGWIKKEDVEPVASSSTAPAALPAKTARLLALEAACKSSWLTLVLAQTKEGTTFLINKDDKPLNYFIVQLPSKKQTLGFLTESLRGVEQHFIDDVEAGKVKFNAVSDANGKPVKDRQGFVLNYLTLPSGREAWAFVKQN